MAQRDRDKAKRGTARQNDTFATPIEPVQRLEAQIKALERERDGLRSELEAVRARIDALEETRTEVANRIDWAIDSLHMLADRSS